MSVSAFFLVFLWEQGFMGWCKSLVRTLFLFVIRLYFLLKLCNATHNIISWQIDATNTDISYANRTLYVKKHPSSKKQREIPRKHTRTLSQIAPPGRVVGPDISRDPQDRIHYHEVRGDAYRYLEQWFALPTRPNWTHPRMTRKHSPTR